MAPGETSQKGYPGPQPCSIDRSHFPTVQKQRYAIATKTDGIRAALLVTDVDGTHTVSLWDRTMTVPYGVSIHNVPRVMYQRGTILDGEVVFDSVTETWTYVIFDSFIIGGLPQYHKSFWDRLEAVVNTLDNRYIYHTGDSLRLEVKRFTSLHEAPLPGEESRLENPSFAADGYVLMPVDQAVIFGHHPEFFKLKTCHSIDFVHKKGGTYVFNTETKRLVKAGTLLVDHDPPPPEGSIIECVLHTWHTNPAKRVWRRLETRVDKTRCNTLFVYNKTILNMEENLGYGDIRALAPYPDS